MKEIEIKNSPIKAIVDDEDFERVSKRNWYVTVSTDKKLSYLATTETVKGKSKMLRIHRFIMGESGEMIDHKDGNTFNNQKSNLRVCTRTENARNSGIRKNKNSRFKGVYFEKRAKSKPWVSAIYISPGKRVFIGSFQSEEEAATSYDQMAKKHFGEFARTNEMMGLIQGSFQGVQIRAIGLSPVNDSLVAPIP